MEINIIYHNPRWSKSRESIKILENSGQEFKIVDYLNNPPSSSELSVLANKMGIRPKDFIRTRENIFKELDLKSHLNDDEFLFKHMSEHPKLIERPIIVKGENAILGRPIDKVKEFLKL